MVGWTSEDGSSSSVRYFPSQDGPAHLNNAMVLREYDHPNRAVFRDYDLLKKHFDPNLFAHVILASLTYILPPSYVVNRAAAYKG
jgi:hypothetical protein